MGKIILAIAFIIGIIIIMPIAAIWSLNTLFPVVAIPYTIETWLAAFIIPAAFKTSVTLNNKD